MSMERGRLTRPTRTNGRKVQICFVVEFVKGRKVDVAPVRFVHHLLQDRDELMGVHAIRMGYRHRSQ